VPKVFSPQTLGAFEDASASIPLRPLDRAFDGAGLRLGKDPGGPDGARRVQFRRYIAGIDQHDPPQLKRLGDALGALIEEVAASKQEFLVKAAEHDGFTFVGGVFRPMSTAPHSFAVTRVEDLTSIGDRGKRLYLIANENPKAAVDGAKELIESVCRLTGEIVQSTLDATCPQQLGAVVASLGEMQNAKALSPRHARLAVGAAVTFAGFVAETYVERRAKNG
jgi:hypothetical protein